MRNQRGFSMLEMLVVVVLMVIILAISNRLLLDAQTSLAHSGRRHADMSVDLALDLMRIDVRNSVEVLMPPGMSYLWNRDALQLLGHVSGDSVVFEIKDDALMRVTYVGGTPSTQRQLMNRVTSFRWRSVRDTHRPAYEIEIGYDDTGPLSRRTAGGVRSAFDGIPRTATFVSAPRQMETARASRWW